MDRIFLTLIIFVSALTVSAQQEPVKFRHLDDNNGLSNNSVLSVCQDYKGFMWFGTRYGLNRYDGHEFKTFNPVFNDTSSISSSHINKIFEDKQKNLWIATRNGLNLYDRDKDQFIRIVLEDSLFTANTYLTSIAEDKNGGIWLSGSGGISKISVKNGKVMLSKNYELTGNKINRLFVDRTNKLWIAGNTGLSVMEKGNIKPFKIIISGKSVTNILVNDIYELKNGDLAIGTENIGLIFLNTNTHEAVNYKYNSSNKNTIINDRVRKVFEDDNGNIWIGTRYGLSIYNLVNKNFKNYSQNIIQPGSLSHNSVKDIYQDVSGGIWIATYAGGLNYFHPWNNIFKHVKEEFGISNTLSYNKVSYLYKDKSGILWIGTEGRGLNRLDERTGIFNRYSSFDDHYEALDNIKSISEDINNVLWIGTNGGLVKFDMENETLKSFVHNPTDTNSLSFNQIHTTLIDKSGKLWIGTNGGGLNLYLPKSDQFKCFTKDDNYESILSNNINYLLEAKDGKLWIGTESGLDCFNPVSQKFIRQNSTKQTKHIIPANKILVLYEDSDNYLWIGTEGNGLICIDKSNFTTTIYDRQEDGLANNIINAIEEDNSKNIWVSTNKGISKLSLNRDSSKIKLITVKNYNKTDGLQSNQFSYRSSFKDNTGKMYFGGIEGYNTFYPNQVKDTILTSAVIFTDLKLNYKTVKLNEENAPIKKSISETKEIILQHFQRQFSLTFVGLNYINPDNVYYSYMLTGFDKQWVFTDKQSTISFTQLQAGEYELKVRASDNPNIWGDNYSKLKIIVLPPPWKTWWAYLAYSIITILILGSILFYSSKWLTLKNKLAFEKHSKEKEKELYQNKVRFFTDVSHELRTPLTLIIGPLEKLVSDVKLNYKLEKQLEIILRSAKKMHALINQLLNLRKFEKGHIKLYASKGNIAGFAKETTLPFREMAKQKGISFEYISSQNQIVAWYDRTKMEIALNNLFSNALKATPSGGNIKVKLDVIAENDNPEASGSFVEITVEDDGKGISPEHITNIFDRFFQPDGNKLGNQLGTGIGLELTMRMVKLHGGSIDVKSRKTGEKEKGFTIFTILIPLGKKHLNPENIISEYRTSEDSSLYKSELLNSELPDIQKDAGSFDFESLLDENKEKPLMVVVEDNQEVCNFIKSLFVDNYRVKTAYNGKKGLQEIIKIIPDIVISDVMMPEMDGIELCSILKTDKRTCHIPVILLTARTELTFKYEGLETGADDYVQKPFSAKYLIMKVKNLLKQRQLMHGHFYRNSIVKPEELALTPTDEILINKAVQYIEKNINDPKLNVDSLSKELALSRVHFYRKIKSITNLTAVEFIRNIRLKKAAQLLETGIYNIDEVKFMIGINDANYFRTSFKKQFGLNPKDYAKKKSFL